MKLKILLASLTLEVIQSGSFSFILNILRMIKSYSLSLVNGHSIPSKTTKKALKIIPLIQVKR